ncbi:MAG: hypothetical protein WB502_04880, partial [Thermoactinomyces sp.]
MKGRFFSFSLSLMLAVLVLAGMVPYFEHLKGVPAYGAASKAVVDRPFYQIHTRYYPEKDEVSGHMVVTLPEKRTKPQEEVFFRLYPNAFRNWKHGEESKPKKPGYIKVSGVKVDGRDAKASFKETVMKVKLPRAVSDGESARIEMDFQLHLPRGGMRLNTFKNTAFLAQWYPMLAVRDRDGWHTEPYTTTGDPFYSQMSDFEVTFQLPEGYRAITTGQDLEQTSPSRFTIRQENVRDFAAVLTKDYQVLRGKWNGIRVNLWYLADMKDVAKPLHEAAVSGMKFYSEKFGP